MKLKRANKRYAPLVMRGLQVALGLVFVSAAWHKIIDPAGFAKIIYGYALFPGAFINILAIWIPFLEAMAGCCLILGVLPRGGLLIINGLLSMFILVIGFNLLRGHEFDCGCFSVAENSSSRSSAVELLVRDLLLLGVGVMLWMDQIRNPQKKASKRAVFSKITNS